MKTNENKINIKKLAKKLTEVFWLKKKVENLEKKVGLRK